MGLEKAVQTLKQAKKVGAKERITGESCCRVPVPLPDNDTHDNRSFTCRTSHGKEVTLTPVVSSPWGGREGHSFPVEAKEES